VRDRERKSFLESPPFATHEFFFYCLSLMSYAEGLFLETQILIKRARFLLVSHSSSREIVKNRSQLSKALINPSKKLPDEYGETNAL